MGSLVNQVIDFVDDTDRSLLKQAAAKAPREVKTAELLTAEDREKLHPTDFALIMRTKEAHTLSKFPVTDYANTWLSCSYFENTKDQLPYVAQKIAASNLKKACAKHKVPVSETISKLASADVSTNVYNEVQSYKQDSSYLNSVETIPAHKDDSPYFYALGDKYPMPDALYVKKASAYFESHVHDFTSPEDRHTFAKNVKSRAEELKVDLGNSLLSKYASTNYGDSVGVQLKIRRDLLDAKPEMQKALDKLASYKDQTEPEIFANVLSEFDRRAGLSKHHGNYLADPYSATFGNFVKTAKGYQWEDESTGLHISGDKLEKTASSKYDKIKGYFGESIAKQLKKHAVSIFESLPLDAKQTIVKIAHGLI